MRLCLVSMDSLASIQIGSKRHLYLTALDRIWGTGDNAITSDLQPPHETAEKFSFWHRLKDHLQKYSSEFISTSSMAVGSVKDPTHCGRRERVAMAQPRALVYGGVRRKVAVVTKETVILEERVTVYNGTPVWRAVYFMLRVLIVFIRKHHLSRSIQGECPSKGYRRGRQPWPSFQIQAYKKMTVISLPVVHTYGGAGVLYPSEKTQHHQSMEFNTLWWCEIAIAEPACWFCWSIMGVNVSNA